MECLWCKTTIAHNFVKTKKGQELEYQACDADCAHGLDVIENLNKGLPADKRINVAPTKIVEEAKPDFVFI